MLYASTIDSQHSNTPFQLDCNIDIPPQVASLFHHSNYSYSVSEKTIKKATIWLLKLAWSKNYCFQSSWTAMALFYGYVGNRTILKESLEAISSP